jgi:hypothetical protein
VCGPDPDDHLAAIEEFAQAGFDHVHVHQTGPDRAGFIDFYEREIYGGYWLEAAPPPGCDRLVAPAFRLRRPG